MEPGLGYKKPCLTVGEDARFLPTVEWHLGGAEVMASSERQFLCRVTNQEWGHDPAPRGKQ